MGRKPKSCDKYGYFPLFPLSSLLFPLFFPFSPSSLLFFPFPFFSSSLSLNKLPQLNKIPPTMGGGGIRKIIHPCTPHSEKRSCIEWSSSLVENARRCEPYLRDTLAAAWYQTCYKPIQSRKPVMTMPIYLIKPIFIILELNYDA